LINDQFMPSGHSCTVQQLLLVEAVIILYFSYPAGIGCWSRGPVGLSKWPITWAF